MALRCFLMGLAGWLASAALLPAADVFDYYLDRTLARVIEAKDTRELKELTTRMLLDNGRVLTGHTGAFLVVKTNEGRHAKLLVEPGRQRVSQDKTLPMLLIEHYVTYKEGEEQTIRAQGRGLELFPGFRLSLDLGQVVPEELGGDLRVEEDGSRIKVVPVGKARLFLVTRPLADVIPQRRPKLVVGETFHIRYFNGTYQLHDDGRRSGKLVLSVSDDGKVKGAYYSDKDGQKYEVAGQVGMPQHSIELTIRFPRTEEVLHGWLFTGDAQVLAGSSRMAEREAGFYAQRIEE